MSASESQEGVRGDHLYEGGKVWVCVLWCRHSLQCGGGGGRVLVAAWSIGRSQNEASVQERALCWESGRFRL